MTSIAGQKRGYRVHSFFGEVVGSARFETIGLTPSRVTSWGGRRARVLKLVASWDRHHVRVGLRVKTRRGCWLGSHDVWLPQAMASSLPLSHSGGPGKRSTEFHREAWRCHEGSWGRAGFACSPETRRWKPTLPMACQVLVIQLHQFTSGREFAGGNERLVHLLEHNLKNTEDR